jgi:hypothetical protein
VRVASSGMRDASRADIVFSQTSASNGSSIAMRGAAWSAMDRCIRACTAADSGSYCCAPAYACDRSDEQRERRQMP